MAEEFPTAHVRESHDSRRPRSRQRDEERAAPSLVKIESPSRSHSRVLIWCYGGCGGCGGPEVLLVTARCLERERHAAPPPEFDRAAGGTYLK